MKIFDFENRESIHHYRMTFQESPLLRMALEDVIPQLSAISHNNSLNNFIIF